MKKIYTLISVLSAASILLPALSSAQIPNPAPSPSPKPDGVEMKKWVEETGDGAYNLLLEAFVTGTSTQTVSSAPCDVVLVLDNSGSMTSNVTIKTETRTDVSTGSTLTVGQTYVAQINGKEYYIKGFSVEEFTDTYTALKSTGYSYNSYTQSYYYYYNGKYYQVNKGGNNNKRNLNFKVGDKTYYLSGTSVTEKNLSIETMQPYGQVFFIREIHGQIIIIATAKPHQLLRQADMNYTRAQATSCMVPRLFPV